MKTQAFLFGCRRLHQSMCGQTRSLFGFDAGESYQRRPRDMRRSTFSSRSSAYSWDSGSYTDYRGWRDILDMEMAEMLTSIMYSKERHMIVIKMKHT